MKAAPVAAAGAAPDGAPTPTLAYLTVGAESV